MKVKDYCHECGIPLFEKNGGLCLNCEKEKKKRRNKYDLYRNTQSIKI